MELNIERTKNGYLIKDISVDYENGIGNFRRVSFEEMDTEHGEIECFQRLLIYVTEYFGMIGSKHDERRIRITTGGEDE